MALLANLVMLQEKKAMVLVGLALLQGLLVQLKASGVVGEEWRVVLMPLTVVEVCLFIALAILLVLMMLEKCSGEEGRPPLWAYHTGLKAVLTSSHFLQLALPVALLYAEGALVPLGVMAALTLHHLAVALLVVLRRQHLICCLSLPQHEVSVLQGSGEAPSAFEKTIQRVSSHWFAVNGAQNPEGPAGEGVLKQEECLVCLTERASMVWAPCGHLTTCEACAAYLLAHARLDCLLCKKQAKNLLKVDIRQPLAGQEYAVQRQVTIVRASVFR